MFCFGRQRFSGQHTRNSQQATARNQRTAGAQKFAAGFGTSLYMIIFHIYSKFIINH
jgi:hypothetical protein